jgi:hypothetical protein
MSEENIPAPPTDDELPPPPAPAEPVVEPNRFEDLKVKKTKPTASLKRGLVIFVKDVKTMTKHGLVGAIVAFIILAFAFYIASYAFEQVVKMDIGGNDDGNSTGDSQGPIGSGVNPPVARMTISPSSSTQSGVQLTFDASASTDNGEIVFYVWNTNDGYHDVELYGKVVHFTFYAVGQHEVHLTVVDNDLNMNETLMTINTTPTTSSDNQAPVTMVEPVSDVTVGQTAFFDGSNSTDNVGIVDYTWMFTDGITRILHGNVTSYTFQNAGYYDITLTVRDAAGNINKQTFGLNVMSLPGDTQPPQANADIPSSVNIGEMVQLDASKSSDDQGISGYTWYVEYNGTTNTLTGEKTSFRADKFGPYNVILVVRDNAGNVNTMDSTVIALPAGMKLDLNQMSWTTMPLPTELSYDLLTFAYGMALVASVVFIGGLFAKSFKHEIVKGTASTLTLSPVSMTSLVFAKVLYAIVLGPIFIIPLVFIGLSRFSPSFDDALMIALVSYFLTALTMVSGAYGSSLIYLAAKKMFIKPPTLSRLFMYLSLIGTLSVFEGITYLMNKATDSTSWNDLYNGLSGIATVSPFHFGGVLLSNMIIGTTWTLDWWIFVIPIVLIVGGVLASTRLYSDIVAKD